MNENRSYCTLFEKTPSIVKAVGRWQHGALTASNWFDCESELVEWGHGISYDNTGVQIKVATWGGENISRSGTRLEPGGDMEGRMGPITVLYGVDLASSAEIESTSATIMRFPDTYCVGLRCE